MLMFDINCEQSFLNLRNWIATIHDTSEDNFLLVILGNKIDLVKDDASRGVKRSNAELLAKENNAIYFELSAREGINVFETVEEVAKNLLIKFSDVKVAPKLNFFDKDIEKKKRCFFF